MTTQRKTYVAFHPLENGSVEVKTLRGEVLGGIAWYRWWKQHVFIPEGGTVFSFDCMEDIAAKVKSLNEVKKGTSATAAR